MRLLVILICLSWALPAWAGSSDRHDALLDRYFSIWGRNGDITYRTVKSLYAPEVVYYGRPMSALQVFEDKLAYVRRWPLRAYRVVPGTGSLHCDPDHTRCSLSARYEWHAAGPAGEREGTSKLNLQLGQTDDGLKILSESGR